jgi:hypothetical protein
LRRRIVGVIDFDDLRPGFESRIFLTDSLASRRTRPCAGADRPAPDSPQIPDSPAGFLESWRAIEARGISER